MEGNTCWCWWCQKSSLKGGILKVSMWSPQTSLGGVSFQQGSEAVREREEDGYTPRKINGWKMYFLYWNCLFRGDSLVFGGKTFEPLQGVTPLKCNYQHVSTCHNWKQFDTFSIPSFYQNQNKWIEYIIIFSPSPTFARRTRKRNNKDKSWFLKDLIPLVFASPVELQAALANELGHPLLKRQRILATLRVSWYLRLGMFNKGQARWISQPVRWKMVPFHKDARKTFQSLEIYRHHLRYSQMMTDEGVLHLGNAWYLFGNP